MHVDDELSAVVLSTFMVLIYLKMRSYTVRPRDQRWHAAPYKICVILATIKVGVKLAWARLWSGDSVDTFISRSRTLYTNNRIRTRFRSNDWTLNEKLKPHSHPISAMTRACANRKIISFANNNGKDIYAVDMASYDQHAQLRGQRFYHTGKDLDLEFRNDSVQENDLIKFIDSDYYAEDFDFLLEGTPALLYTFFPKRVADVQKEYTYTIIDNKVHYNIAGGARYVHSIWNWFTDSFYYDVGDHRVYCKVEQVPVGNDRYIVGIFPTVSLPLSVVYMAKFFRHSTELDSAPLTRLRYKRDVVNSLRFHDPTTGVMTRSLGVEGEYNSILVEESSFLNCKYRFTRSKERYISEIQQLLPVDGSESKTAATFHRILSIADPYDNLVTLPDVNYYCQGPIPEENFKAIGRVAHQPFLDLGVVPNEGRNADLQTIEGRIEKPREKSAKSDENYTTIKEKYWTHIKWFNEQIVPKRIHPKSRKDVNRLMTKRRQKLDFERFGDYLGKISMTVKSFMKKESYGKITDPRNISTVPTQFKIEYSRYTLALKDCFKQCRWYAFSKTPKQISKIINGIASKGKVLMTDFSRFDGHHSKILMEAEADVMNRGFGKIPADLLKSQYQIRGFTRFGIKYKTGYSRLSGSPDTSLFNTYDNALMSFLTYIEQGFSQADAWECLGLYGGDDGCNGHEINPDTYVKVCEEFGQEVEKTISEYSEPVTFLARTYPAPHLSTNNHMDIRRILSKLHITTAPKTVPIELALRRKAEGLAVTDPHTPIVRAWVKKILELTADVKDQNNDYEKSYWAAQGPFDNIDCDENRMSVANELRLFQEDIFKIEQHIEKAKTLEDVGIPFVIPGKLAHSVSVLYRDAVLYQ